MTGFGLARCGNEGDTEYVFHTDRHPGGIIIIVDGQRIWPPAPRETSHDDHLVTDVMRGQGE